MLRDFYGMGSTGALSGEVEANSLNGQLRHRALLLLACVFLVAKVFGADTILYDLQITPTGDRALDQSLLDVSRLSGLREAVPVGPFALLARAQSDLGRFDMVLRSFGYYDGLIDLRIAGRAPDDLALLPELEALRDGAKVTVLASVDTGPLYRLDVVRLEGAVPDAVRARFDLQPGQPARAADVLAAGEAVSMALQEEGFALARVPAPEAVVDHDTRTMDVVYRVDPGPRVTIGAVSVTGLGRLREDYVRRRLGLRIGEPFSPTRLESARQDLMSAGVLAWARLAPGTEPDEAGRLPLTLEVAERPARVVRLAGAFSSDEGATVAASWTHRNLWGRAERLTLGGEIGRVTDSDLGSLTYLVSAGLTVPDLWRRDLDLRLDGGAVSESLDAYDRDAATAGLALERRLAAGLAASAGLAFERSRVRQDGPAVDYWLLSLPLTVSWDKTDNALDPSRGVRLAVRVAPTRLLESGGQGFVVARLAGSTYLVLDSAPVASEAQRRTVLAARLVLGSIFGATADAVPPDWRFYAGGGGSVRGYPFQSIGPRTASDSPAGGDGLLEAALELRRRWGENWGGVLFADAGAVSRDGIPGSGALAVGLGVGVRYFTAIGPVRVDLATPLSGCCGGSSVQLYIGIGQAF